MFFCNCFITVVKALQDRATQLNDHNRVLFLPKIKETQFTLLALLAWHPSSLTNYVHCLFVVSRFSLVQSCVFAPGTVSMSPTLELVKMCFAALGFC